MTAIVTNLIATTITSNSFDARSATLGAIVVLLLTVLLALKELRRAFGGPRFRVWSQTLNIAILPLLLAFGLIITMRFLDLFGLI